MLTCLDIAYYFLDLANDDDYSDLLSNMKLQKLVYYAQGFYIAKFDRPLFNSTIEAWNYGPVIPDLYQEFKKYGKKPIKLNKKLDFSKYNNQVREILDSVYVAFGQYSAWRLSQMTHDEPPWLVGNKNPDKIISLDEMNKYFKTQLA